jgi:hypothetical protein
MEIKQGPVSKLRASIEVSGTDKSTSTTHVVYFQLGPQAVVLRAKDPPAINDGDQVKVAGSLSKGLSEALAYRNESTGVSGDSNTLAAIIVGGIFSVIGIGGVLAAIVVAISERDGSALLGVAFFGIFGGFGVYALRKFARVREAAALLSS